MMRFSCFVIACLALVACGNGLPFPIPGFDAGVGGAGGDSSSSSSSSSGTPAAFVCPGKVSAFAPIDGEAGLPYHEHGVRACRRFGAGTYTTARITWPLGAQCTLTPEYSYAVGPYDALTGFSWSAPVPLPLDGIVPITATPGPGNALFVCAVLAVGPNGARSCIRSCADKLDPDSFWGDTGADGYVLDPPVLEPLSASPTPTEAVAFGNDKQRLMIEAW